MKENVARRVWELLTADVFRLVGPILAIAAVVLFFYMTTAAPARPRLFGFLGPYLAVTIGVTYLALLLHELGHVLGSRLAGFRVVEVAVEPWVVRLDGRRRRVRLVWGVLVGWVRSDPVNPEWLRHRHCLIAVCGPAANLVMAVPLLLVAVIDASVHHYRSLIDALIFLYGGAVGLMGIGSLVPRRSWARGSWSDGMWLWLWLRKPERAAAAMAHRALSVADERGIRPRDWDPRWVRLSVGNLDRDLHPEALSGNMLAYIWALDRGDIEQAATFLEVAYVWRKRGSFRLRQAIAIEMAYFLARHRADPEAAEQVLDIDARKPFAVFAGDAARARAAIALAGGRFEQAQDLCERVLAELPPRDDGITAVEREQLQAIRDQAVSAVRAPAFSNT